MLAEFTDANLLPRLDVTAQPIAPGSALLWDKKARSVPLLVQLQPSRTERRRHLRKYAEGELPPDRSFFFRGPHGKLNLRAHNLIMFLELADGVDDDTWLFHLRKGHVSAWLREAIKDDALAEQVRVLERSSELDPVTSRQTIRQLIEALYTLPATPPRTGPGSA
jgi:hypothetical protein